ncbi:MAG: DNA-binding protein [bacterium]
MNGRGKLKIKGNGYSMRRLYLILLTVSASLVYIFSGSAHAFTPLSADTLINESNSRDGQMVRFQGEVVGDIMYRGTHCWINVHDGSQALGVFCRAEMVKRIKYVGDYKHTGDIIEVTGIFHKACREHGGELDIHARQVRIMKPGTFRPHPVQKSKVHTATALFLLMLFVLWQYNRRKKSSA